MFRAVFTCGVLLYASNRGTACHPEAPYPYGGAGQTCNHFPRPHQVWPTTRRHGAAESLRRLWRWIHSPGPSGLCPPPHLWREDFSAALQALQLDTFGFRPYFLRRGGATFWFNKHGSLDRPLLHERWAGAKTARLYINDGLATLADLRLPESSLRPFTTVYYNALNHSLPPLERPHQVRRAGGRGKGVCWAFRGLGLWWFECVLVVRSGGSCGRMPPEKLCKELGRPAFLGLAEKLGGLH